jgi:hypothetical protein
MDLVGQLHIADSPVLLKGFEDQFVVSVYGHGRKLLIKLFRQQKMPDLPDNVTYLASYRRGWARIVAVETD